VEHVEVMSQAFFCLRHCALACWWQQGAGRNSWRRPRHSHGSRGMVSVCKS